MKTYSDLYLEVRRRLKAEHLPAADLEARELVCFAAGKKRDDLPRDGGLYVSPEAVERTWQLVDQHLTGEPVAYIISEWEFYGLSLDITPDVLIPRPDTEVLVKQAIRFLRTLDKKRNRVLDLCSGSGCVGLAVASQVPWSRVVLGDLSEAALKICHRNTLRNVLNGQVVSLRMDARERPDPVLGQFACVVCNPPYIPTGDFAALDPSVRDYEPRLALDGGADGLDFFRAVSDLWREAVAPGGRLFFEVGIGQAEAVRAILEANGFEDIQTEPDLNGIPRVVSGAMPEKR